MKIKELVQSLYQVEKRKKKVVNISRLAIHFLEFYKHYKMANFRTIISIALKCWTLTIPNEYPASSSTNNTSGSVNDAERTPSIMGTIPIDVGLHDENGLRTLELRKYMH